MKNKVFVSIRRWVLKEIADWPEGDLNTELMEFMTRTPFRQICLLLWIIFTILIIIYTFSVH